MQTVQELVRSHLAEFSKHLLHNSEVCSSIQKPVVTINNKHASCKPTKNDTYATNFMVKFDHPNTVLKNESTAFLYLLNMGSANMKYMHCSMLDSYSVQLKRHEF